MSSPTHTQIQLTIAELLDPTEVVAYRPRLARALKSPLAALFLCQAIYWQKVSNNSGSHFFFKLRDAEKDQDGKILPPSNAYKQSWQYELGMSRSEQETARKVLEKHKLLETKRVGIPAKLYYRVNLDEVAKFIVNNQQLARNNPTSQDGSNQQGRGNSSSSMEVNSPTKRGGSDHLYTETTSENTPEITSPAAEEVNKNIDVLENQKPDQNSLSIIEQQYQTSIHGCNPVIVDFSDLVALGMVEPKNKLDVDTMELIKSKFTIEQISVVVSEFGDRLHRRSYCSNVLTELNARYGANAKTGWRKSGSKQKYQS